MELIRALECEGADGEHEDGERLARLAAKGASRAIMGRVARLGPTSPRSRGAVAILEPNAEARLIASLTGLAADRVAAAGGRLVSSSLLATGGPSPSCILWFEAV